MDTPSTPANQEAGKTPKANATTRSANGKPKSRSPWSARTGHAGNDVARTNAASTSIPQPDGGPEPSSEKKKKPRNRKKKSLGGSGASGTASEVNSGSGTPAASGSSSPRLAEAKPETISSPRDKGPAQPSGSSNPDNAIASNAPIPTTTASEQQTAAVGPSSFVTGDDFIPFDFDLSGDEAGDGGLGGETHGRVDVKGKGKAFDDASKDVDEPSSRANERDRDRDRDGGRYDDEHRVQKRDDYEDREDSSRSRKRSRRDKSRSRSRSRSRDRDSRRDRARDRRDKDRDRRDGDRDGDRRDRDKNSKNGFSDNRDADKDRYDSYGYHSSKAPWIRGVDLDRCKNVAEMLHQEVEAFTRWISPTPIEDEIRSLVVMQISQAVKTKFPDATVMPFGSYETKLYLPLGDIDLVIMSESMAWSDKVTVLRALANTLKRAGITSNVSIIAKAKVPIVKFVTSHGRFNVDISINQMNGLFAGQIINGFLKHMSHEQSTSSSTSVAKTSLALRSLVLITKAFLAQRNMNEVYTGGLGSYSIVCLAVSFLQMHPKIRRGEIDPDRNLGVLVMEFFELYGTLFNYDEVGISVREGGTYFSKRQRGWFDYQKRGLLSVEDPADPSNDISKGSFAFHKVKTAFAGAHSILTATAYLRAGIIGSRRSGRSVNLRGYQEPEDLSILSTVMGITQETLNHRKLVQELYNRRTLHDILRVKPAPTIDHNANSNGASSSSKKKSKNKNSSPPPSSKELRIKGVGSKQHDGVIDLTSYDSDTNKEEPGSRQRNRRPYGDEGDDEEASGRYDIVQPPRKRQRTGKPKDDYHTAIFVTDDDEDEEDDGLVIGGLDVEEDEQESRYNRKPVVRDAVQLEKADRTRSYWLSKGIGPGLGEDGFEDGYSD
ncbi:hypothetical protein FA15DRAFT_670964 [Coprinopsis marcescibilis]|uniref:polynucleotide adenylyltransferase n=1 Tax=Coprinopsis marcescibilis TaxID=230819 RepID=A0A5C3L444_COPMA|nr:hypothetical protein FA15DRAFT_670964 [Coprinopsis marcescibilis]